MKKFFILMALMALATNCGSGGDDDDEESSPSPSSSPAPSIPVKGNTSFRISGAVDDRDNGDFSQTAGTSCDKDLNSGLFHLRFTEGDNTFELRVKNLSSSPRSYSCEQASSNTGKDQQDELGDLFHTCMVSVKAEASDAGGYSGYDIYRSDALMSPFAYTGECTIDIEEVDSVVAGNVDCKDMVQSYRDGSLRNPINEDVVASISGDFSCDLRKN